MPPKPCSDSTVWALDNGPTTSLSDDQRELGRPVGDATDIGAVECQDEACGHGSFSGITGPPPPNGHETDSASSDGGFSMVPKGVLARSNSRPAESSIFDELFISVEPVEWFPGNGRDVTRESVAASLWTDPLELELL